MVGHKATRFALLAEDVGRINNLDVIVSGNLVSSHAWAVLRKVGALVAGSCDITR